ncbi:MAG: iron-containing alcohol dehydrogenase [Ruminiclostridium sp.]|nr:iron-containing alcohol dehydrogenase [Ruminiclostridium sp.]
MNDFRFYNPVRIHFGREAMAQLPEELAGVGKKILLVYGGGSIKASGLYDRVLAALREAGKDVVELPGVMPNPRTEKVYEGIDLCKANGVDFILAVGGGSVIDCAKAIAVGARTDRDFWQAFFVNWEEAEDAIPLGTILTIPATGSEMDRSSVITNWATGEKNGYDSDLTYPVFSILDPTLTYTLPKHQMVNGVVDTLSHIWELYFSEPDTESVTDALAEALMRSVISATRTALKDPTDYVARANIMWASTFALCGMLNNGKKTDWASHNIEHPLSAVFDVAHGAGLAVVHPNYMKYFCSYAPERYARYAVQVWGVDPAGKTTLAVAQEGIQRTRDFFNEIGAPATLTDLGIPESAIEDLAARTDLSCWAYRELTREDVKAILGMCL